jgi:hypothetical protein
MLLKFPPQYPKKGLAPSPIFTEPRGTTFENRFLGEMLSPITPNIAPRSEKQAAAGENEERAAL